MVKKICIIVGLCMMLSIMRVAASDKMTVNAEYDFKTDTVTVTGTIPDGRHRLVLLQVLRPEFDKSSGVTPQNASETIFYTDDTNANSDGSYRFEFALGSGISGEYTFKVASSAPNVSAVTTLECINVKDIEKMLKQINESAGWTDIRTLFEEHNAASILGLNTKLYATVLNRDLIYQQIYAEKTRQNYTFAGVDRLETLFDTVTVLAKINESDDPESIMKENADLLGYLKDSSGTQYTFNTLLDDTARKSVFAAHKNCNFKSTEEIQIKFAQTTILYAVEGCKWQALANIIENNITHLDGIDYEKYKKLTSAGTAAVKIMGTLYPSVQDFITKFNDETDKEYKKENQATSSTSKGGGGGSSTGKVITSTIIPEIAEDIPETPDIVPFADIAETHWAADAISYLQQQNIVSGRENGIFAPDDPVTREEFVKMVVLALKIHNSNRKCDFSDVPLNHWASSYIQSAIDAELIYGIDDSSFGLEKKITRQDMSVIIYRIYVKKTDGFVAKEIELPFTDQDAIADYAMEAVEQLYGLKIINGVSDTMFAPLSELTRAQAAKVIYDVIK